MPANTCPNCQTIRPPNAAFCPACGTAFDGSRGPAPAVSRQARDVDLGVWTGIKFGGGFVIGATVVGVAFWIVLAILVVIGLSLPAVSR